MPSSSRALRALIFGLLGPAVACQPGTLRADEPPACLVDPPAPGEIQVAVVACGEMGLARGESTNGDYWLANDRFRVVLRHPQASLTLVGAGGGTVIDGGPWGQQDWLHEVAPLVGGGWLSVDQAEPLEDGIRLAGTVVSLPDRPATAAGERAEVIWRIAPDDPWLRFEGADGLWLHASGAFEIVDDWLWSDLVVFGHDGESVEDLGGALRIQGATGLFFGTPRDALIERAEGRPILISGTAVGAERIEVEQDGLRVGWFGVAVDGTFRALVPPGVDRIRGTASGRTTSFRQLPGTDKVLDLGDPGSFEIRPAWGGARGRPLRIDWTAFDSRSGVAHLPAVGGTLFLGAGDYDLVVSAGPAFETTAVTVETGAVGVPLVAVDLGARFDPGSHVLGAFGVPVDRSRTWRGSDSSLATAVAGLGADWMVFAPEDDVADVDDSPTAFPIVAHRNGSRTVGALDAWSVTSWPWTSNEERPGHGAVYAQGLSAEDGLAAAVGGISRDRHTVVDLAWLEHAPAPWAVDPLPEGVFLEPPGALGPAAWAPWFAWLDTATPLTPVGELAWLPVEDPTAVANEDIEQAFTAGRSVATTGPLLRLTVANASPGDIAASTHLNRLVEGWVGGADDLDHLALIGDGGVILRQWDLAGSADAHTVNAIIPPGRWLVLAGWDDAGTAFAATSPIWTDAP